MSDGALSQTFGIIPFDIPNIKIERHEAHAHARIGWMRSVYNIPLAFGVGSFVDDPAIANAVFAATQKRIRELPLSKHFQV